MKAMRLDVDMVNEIYYIFQVDRKTRMFQTLTPQNIPEHIPIIAFHYIECGFEGEHWSGEKGINDIPDGKRRGVHSECECKELCEDNDLCKFWLYDNATKWDIILAKNCKIPYHSFDTHQDDDGFHRT